MRFVLAVSMLVIAGACGAWDIYVIAKGNSEDTVSRTLHDWSLLYPILPLILGLIIGHIFWPQTSVRILRD